MPLGSKPSVLVVIPCAAVDALARASVAHSLQLQYENFRVLLLPDDPYEPPVPNPRLLVLPTGMVTIARKRNLAMAAMPGQDFFAFLDSDAFPDPQWLNRAIENFSRLPGEVWLVGGPNISPPDQSFSAAAVGAAMKSVILSGAGAYRKRRSPSRYCRELPACNLVARSEALRLVNGFDERLLTGEDTDLCARMRAQGGKIFFAQDVCVFHHDRQLLLPFLRQRFVYGSSVWGLFQRDPCIHKAYLFLPFFFLLGLLAGPFLFWLPLAFAIYTGALLLFGLFSLGQAIRWAPPPAVPFTMLAFFLGVFVPGLGSAYALIRIPKSLGPMYRKSRNSG